MKVIIAGSSKANIPFALVRVAVARSQFEITEVVSGKAPGVDRMGERWAHERDLPIQPFPARWRESDGSFDRSAGMIRNGVMAKYADALVAVWDGRSPGTRNMIERMQSYGKPIYVLRTDLEDDEL